MHAGTLLRGVLAKPDGPGPFPALLLYHSGRGLMEFYKAMAPKLAALGYLVVACDMFGADVDIRTPEAAGPTFRDLHAIPGKLRSRVVAWFDAIAARDEVDAAHIGAIGFCLGGECVLELARSGADVQAVVSFHGLLTTASPARKGEVKAHVAAYCARYDPYVPIEHVDGFRHEMEAAGIDYDLMVFGKAEHGFTDPDSASLKRPGISFEPLADKVSWAGALALLEAKLLS